jgi:dTDP-4-amino-4,6-dideoxygalactose transaminase
MLLLSTIPAGSEVIMPAFTFSATYQACKWNGLKPVLVDCDKRGNIDPEEVKKAISPNTKAILAVHMFGHPAPISELEELAAKNGLKLFFDAAHAFGSKYHGKYVGGFGDAEVFSLGPTKTIPVGEGGLVTTNDGGLAERIRLAANHGHGPGELDARVHGMNARLEEINGVVGLHILKQIEKNIERRLWLANLYIDELKSIKGIKVIEPDNDIRSTFKDFAIYVDETSFGCSRDKLCEALTSKEIMTKKYYDPPIHYLTVAREEFAGRSFPVTEKLSSTTLSLPFYSHMPEGEIEQICEAIAWIGANSKSKK